MPGKITGTKKTSAQSASNAAYAQTMNNLRNYYISGVSITATILLAYHLGVGKSPFINTQYPTILTKRGLEKIYRQNNWNLIGWYDILTVCFYTMLAVPFHALYEDVIKLVANLNNMEESDVKRYIMSCCNVSAFLAYYAAAFYLVFWVVPMDWQSFVAGYPNKAIPHEMKLFLIINLAFWLQNVPKIIFEEEKNEEITEDFCRALLVSLFIIVSVLSETPLACVFVLNLIVAGQLLRSIADLITIHKDAVSDLAFFFSCLHAICVVSEKFALIVVSLLLANKSPTAELSVIRWMWCIFITVVSLLTLAQRLLGYFSEDYRQPGGFVTNANGLPTNQALDKKRN